MKLIAKLLILLLLEQAAFAGQVAISVSAQTRYDIAKHLLNKYVYAPERILPPERKLAPERVLSYTDSIISKIKSLKNARLVSATLSSKANVYILATSILGTTLFDYLIDNINQQANDYLQAIPPPDCTHLIGYSSYVVKRVCNGSGGDFQADYVDINTVAGWTNQGDGGCFARFSQQRISLAPGDCIDIAYPSNSDFFDPWRGYYRPGKTPSDYLPTRQSSSPAKVPPFVLVPLSDDEIKKYIPNTDYIATLRFPDSSSILNPSDVPVPLQSPDGSVSYDLPNSSPDYRYSPDISPNNPVLDIPVDGVKVDYKIINPTTGQEYNYSNAAPIQNQQTQTQTQQQNQPQQNYDYSPTNSDVDSNIEVPEKKDLSALILSAVSELKDRFTFDSSCGSGACSFTVSVFGYSGVIDFCQFSSEFQMIGSIVLAFAYFYAFFIITKGG